MLYLKLLAQGLLAFQGDYNQFVQAFLKRFAPLVSQQYDYIFSFMPTFFFLFYFTLSHVTLLSHGSHVQSHDGSHDLSHDEGT